LAQLLRADLLPEAWIAPPAVRQLRALLRHRTGLIRLRTQQQNRIHAVVADFGYDRAGSYLSGPGRGWLAELELPAISRAIVTDALAVIDGLAVLIDRIDGELRQHAKADPRVKTLTTLPGVGQFTALAMLAEIGDISRFPSARKLASWAGLTPTVRGSDRSVRHGHISKQGSAWLRWVLNQAAQTAKRSPEFAATYQTIAKRRGKEDRHHRDRPQAADPRLAPAGRHASHRPGNAAAAVTTGGSPSPGHARSCGMSRRPRRARSSD
jgi:transposase